jgi:hypothetical protein
LFEPVPTSRDCTFPVILRHGSGHGAQTDPSRPFDDRAVRRAIVRCAKYAPAGAKELTGLTPEALGEGHAALLSNDCALATGPTPEAALIRARELEILARLYAITLTGSAGHTFR